MSKKDTLFVSTGDKVLPPATIQAGTKHEIKPELRYRNYNNDWLLVVLLFGFSIFAIVNTVYSRRFLMLLKAFGSISTAGQIVRSDNILSKQVFALLSALFFISFSVFVYQVFVFYYGPSLFSTGISLYFAILAGVFVFYFGKIILCFIFGFLFGAGENVREYVFNLLLVNQVIGLVMLPLACFINYAPKSYTPPLLAVGLLLVAGLFLYRIIKGFFILPAAETFSKSYLFLYLCALEILPLLVLGKLIVTKYQL